MEPGDAGREGLPPTRTSDEETEPLDEALEPSVARTVGGRYALQRRIGTGGHGEVWSARDGLTGRDVAVKLLRDASRGTFSARVRREIAALRLLHVPGVVRLLDEGADELGAFVVMELLRGTAFPGRATPCTWGEIAETTVALLETLGRIHHAGVVHRDLKPANVLVDDAGLPTVLDFGVAFAPMEGTGDAAPEMVGTPAYLAPEQVAREPVSPATDLYALGLMLYEALSGRSAFEGHAVQAVMYARVFRDAEPLRTWAPGVPRAVAETVDALLRRRPDARPRDAAEVIRMLRGDRAAADVTGVTRIALPRLGGDGPVRAIADALAAGRSVDVVGATGAGRTRALREALDLLAMRGVRSVGAMTARDPYASLSAVLGSVIDDEGAVPSDEAVDALLDARLGDGAVVVADDAERLDPWTRNALVRRARRAPVLRALRAGSDDVAAVTVTLRPLTVDELAPMFAGPERIFHIPGDAARALWTRTGGLAARVAAEVSAWVRAGVARWTPEGRLSVDRRALDTLSLSTLSPRPRALRVAGRSVFPPSIEGGGPDASGSELLAWVSLAAPESTTALLAAVTGWAETRVATTLDALARDGRVRCDDHGAWELAAPFASDTVWTPSQRRCAHAALAATFAPGTEGRLAHLVAAASLDGPEAHDDRAAEEIAHEAVALARRRAREGRVGPAIAALSEAMMASRRLGLAADAPAHHALLAAWVSLALADGTPHALDRVHYEICRASTRTADVEHLSALVRAALGARSGGARGLSLADAVEPFADPELERCRHAVRVQAARRASLADEARVVDELARWADATGDDAARAQYAEWCGRLRYRQLRFVEAAQLHEQSLQLEPTARRRLGALTGAASAWLDALRPDRAATFAQQLCAEAAACKHPYFEAWGEYLVRAAAYRNGAPLTPDLELTRLVAQLGVRDLEALATVNEAAIAWRCGDRDVARQLASHAHALWVASGWVPGAGLARSLAVASGAPIDRAELDVLSAWAATSPLVRVGLQSLALLATAVPSRVKDFAALASPLLAAVPDAEQKCRLEVLSSREAGEHLQSVVRA